MPPDVVHTCGGMSSCGVEMSLPKLDFTFYGWHGNERARHMPTTSVLDGLGCLNRGAVAFHQWTSIPSHLNTREIIPGDIRRWPCPSLGGSPSLRR